MYAKTQHISFQQALQLSNIAITVEDLINTSNEEFRILKDIICFRARHFLLSPLICLAHTLVKNRLYSLIRLFSGIVFMTGSFPSLIRMTLRESGAYEKQSINAIVRNFAADTRRYQTYLYDSSNHSFGEIPVDQLRKRVLQHALAHFTHGQRSVPMANQRPRIINVSDAIERATRIISRMQGNLKPPNQTVSLFEILLTNLQDFRINEYDFSIMLQVQKKTALQTDSAPPAKKKRSTSTEANEHGSGNSDDPLCLAPRAYNLLDFCITASTAKASVTDEDKMLYVFLNKQLSIPQCLILNNQLKDLHKSLQ